MERVEIVAVCDIILERAENAAKILNNGALIFTDYTELLKLEEIDAVDICTPNYLHSIITIAAFKAGKHVFCEKPDAVCVEEALKMKIASEEAGKTLMVMRNQRYIQTASYLKKFINDGEAGEIYAGRCGWIRRRGIPGKGGWFTTKELSGGGPLIDLGVHMIDLAIWLMGNPTPVSVSGSTFCKFANDESDSDSEHAKFGDAIAGGIFDVEDLAMGFIKFDNGACLQIECSWASNIKKESYFLELRGTKAGVSYDRGEIEIYTEKYGKQIDILPSVERFDDTHGRNINHFIEVILDGKKPEFVPQQGVNMIKILTAVYESAKTGKEVSLI
jgi:predicted dehydrogenase